MDRRDFLKTAVLAAGALNFKGANALAASARKKVTVNTLKKPVAIAMWDFSWLLRHHQGGEFENWDMVLDGLAHRGYNAVRIDAFPQLIAGDENGKIEERFYCPKENWNPAMWGNDVTCYIEPRKGLLEFMSKCRERGIYVGLSTWFRGEDSHRESRLKGEDGFIRVWDETLSFLKDNGQMDNVIYVDLLNEFPMWHGFDWLHGEIEKRKSQASGGEEVKKDHLLNNKIGKYNAAQVEFYRNFMSSTLKYFKGKWSDEAFMYCFTNTDDVPWEAMDISMLDCLDVHYWFVQDGGLSGSTGYWGDIHAMPNDMNFAKCYNAMKAYWKEHKTELISWMDGKIKHVADTASEYKIAAGNTEGWGAVCWLDNPNLDWKFIKEAGLICAELGAKYNYRFNCSSNFTHPQFKGMWNDVKWHKQVTSIIRHI